MRNSLLKWSTMLIACSVITLAQATPVLLFAAGGGGGAAASVSNGGPGQTSTSGASASGSDGGAGGQDGSGGGGGSTSICCNGGGGAGWLGNGGNGAGTLLSGSGGMSGPTWTGGIGINGIVKGGYGGGGGGGDSGAGGGGGYSGGGGGRDAVMQVDGFDSGGGGSYLGAVVQSPVGTAGKNGSSTAGANGVDGFVTIAGVTTIGFSGSTFDWFAPTTTTYQFIVDGAQGGGSYRYVGGYGAEVAGDVFLMAGTELEFVVGGGGGGDLNDGYAGGGGGGTFVYEVFVPSADPGTVPEPTTLALLGLGFAGLALRRRAVA